MSFWIATLLAQLGPAGPAGPAGPEASLVSTALSGIIGSGPLVAVLGYLLWRLWGELKLERAEVARLNAECKSCKASHTAQIVALYRELVEAVSDEKEKSGGS